MYRKGILHEAIPQTKIPDDLILILICLCRICSYDVHFYIDTGSQFAVLADLDEISLMMT